MMQKNVYSVEQLNKYIKNMFTQDYLLRSLQVKGEISNCKYHPTGHIYFTLKEGSSALKCVMFAGKRNRGLGFTLADGQRVIITGCVDVYLDGGQYQLYADKIELDGLGALYEKYELLKRELEEEGMFAPEYKRPLPKNAQRIGIATASSGAAVRDIINVAKRRNPYVELILYPTAVQGAEAAPGIVKAIKALDEYGVDIIIVGRGGGSIEDLWAFNERIVAQAIFDSNTPIISAVGHEVDFTIADFVADKRAATPSAAAEIAVRELREIDDLIADRRRRLDAEISERIRRARTETEYKNRQLALLSPQARLKQSRERVIGYADRLERSFESIMIARKNRLALAASKLDGVSPLKRLESGFAYLADEKGKRIKSVSQVVVNDRIKMTLADGEIKTVVTDVINTRE